uniref:G_PROTEIN_RECEP_F1_2 domain-containing protein n=1 Tax=Steinernema glaseri TaxID=37863 RepID=A0A1I7YJK4_9BILA
MFPGYLMVMLTIYSVVFTIGFAGNLWVIISLVRILYRTWSPLNSIFQHISLYILSLSIVDLLVLMMIPMLLVYFVNGSWDFGFVACKIFWTVENVNKLLSVAILAVMSFERYVAVCKPFQWFCCRTRHNVLLVLTVLLFFIVLLCMPIIYYADTTRHNIMVNDTVADVKVSCSSDLPDAILPVFILYMFVFGFLLPALFISLCYIFLIKHISKKTPPGKAMLVSSYTNRVVRSILRVVIFHFACWTPFWIFVLVPMLSFFNISNWHFLHSQTLAVIRLITSFLPYINSAGNWIFYAALNREMRENVTEHRRRIDLKARSSKCPSKDSSLFLTDRRTSKFSEFFRRFDV